MPTPSQAGRRTLPAAVRRPVARLRNRSETAIGELTDLDRLRLARHGAIILAHTIRLLALV